MPPALMLTAGLGTRLLPLTLSRAKPAVPVANVPLVARILRWLSTHGVRGAVLNLHHHPETIARQVGDGTDVGLRVRYSWEWPQVLGSAGGPRKALPLLESDRFLIVNGDTLSELPLPELVADHCTSGALVTLAVVPNVEPDRYGGVLVEADGRVTGFTRRGSREPSWHFVGIQAVEARVFSSLPEGSPAETVGELYPRLMAADPRAVRAWRTHGTFLDVGTPADYLTANIRLAALEGHDLPLVGVGGHVHPSARIDGCVLWDEVEVGEGACLERCVVADGARIPAGARYADRVIVPAPAGPFAVPGGSRLEGSLIVAPLDSRKLLEPGSRALR